MQHKCNRLHQTVANVDNAQAYITAREVDIDKIVISEYNIGKGCKRLHNQRRDY